MFMKNNQWRPDSSVIKTEPVFEFANYNTKY